MNLNNLFAVLLLVFIALLLISTVLVSVALVKEWKSQKSGSVSSEKEADSE